MTTPLKEQQDSLMMACFETANFNTKIMLGEMPNADTEVKIFVIKRSMTMAGTFSALVRRHNQRRREVA